MIRAIKWLFGGQIEMQATVNIPAIDPEKPAPKPQTSAPKPELASQSAPAAVKSIADKPVMLIVDDDPDVITSLSLVLNNEFPDHAIEIAVDGREAVDKYQQTKAHLIILDMMLPKLSGFLVLEKIYAMTSNRKDRPVVIMITGNLGSRHKTYAESKGVEGYLNKPFRLPTLVDMIKRELAKKQNANTGQSP